MRDDVKVLFNDLMTQLNSKRILLNSLLENEKSASDLIKYRNDAEDDLLKIVEQSAALIDEINVADYNVSQIRDDITRRYSFDFSRIFMKDFKTSENEILNYKNEILQHGEILDSILALKKGNSLSLEKSQKDLEIQISELERMSRFELVVSKDPQSS